MSEKCDQNCSNCSQDCAEREKNDFSEKPHEMSNIKKVIGIVSGKGSWEVLGNLNACSHYEQVGL